MSDSEFSSEVAQMGQAGLRFAEQFELERVLAAFECELLEVLGEVKATEVERDDARSGD